MTTIDFASSQAEREEVFRLRYRVYVREQGKGAESADHAREMLIDADDAHGRLLAARHEGKVVGTLRLSCGADAPFSPELHETFRLGPFVEAAGREHIAVFSRFTVEREFRGGPVPFQLMAAAGRYAGPRAPVVFCDCQPHLLGLYHRIGFRPYRPVYNHPGSGMLVPLVLLSDDRDYLRSIDWPLWEVLEGVAPDPARLARLLALLPARPPVRSPQGPEDREYFGELFGLLSEAAPEASVFADLSPADVQRLVERSHLIECAAGDVVIRSGQVTRTLFVVLAGSLEVLAGEQLVGVSVPGDVVGEVAFLLGTRRMHDVRAGAAGARLISLNEKTLQSLIDGEAAIAARLLRNLARGLGRKLLERTRSPGS